MSQSPQTGHVGFYTSHIGNYLQSVLSQCPQTGHVGFYPGYFQVTLAEAKPSLNPLKRVMLVSILVKSRKQKHQKRFVSIPSNGSCWFLYDVNKHIEVKAVMSQSPQTGHVGFYSFRIRIGSTAGLRMSQSPQTGHVGFYSIKLKGSRIRGSGSAFGQRLVF